MNTTRTLVAIEADIAETVAAWAEARTVAARARTAARIAGERGGKDSVIVAANRLAAAEAEAAEYEALRDRLHAEALAYRADPANAADLAAYQAAKDAAYAAEVAEHGDPFDIPGQGGF